MPLCKQGRSWYPPEQTRILYATLITDASKYAWGATWQYGDVTTAANNHIAATTLTTHARMPEVLSAVPGPPEVSTTEPGTPEVSTPVPGVPTTGAPEVRMAVPGIPGE